MSQEQEIVYNIGYNKGWAAISPVYDTYLESIESNPLEMFMPKNQLSVLSASITKTVSIPTVSSHYLPSTGGKQSLIRVGDKLVSYSGDINFQLTKSALDVFFHNVFFQRNSLFTFGFGDNQGSYNLYNCVWSSITINGDPSSLVNVSISFMSNNAYQPDITPLMLSSVLSSFTFNHNNAILDDPIPYWQTGAIDMLKFSLSFNRSVNPIYLNTKNLTPDYFRVGRMDISANCTYLKGTPNISDNSLSILLGNKSIIFNGAYMKTKSINNDKAQEEGQLTVTYQSITEPGVDIFTIISPQKQN